MTELNNETILVIDDVPDWLDTCSDILSDEGYRVLTTLKSPDALRIVEEQTIDLVVTDLTMPEMNGIELVRRIQEKSPGCNVILITGFPTVETAIQALKAGASDYLLKPFTPEQLVHAVKSALDKSRLRRENQYLRSQVQGLTKFGELIGQSPAMHKLFGELERVAKMDARVVLMGESGTGKELSARVLHRHSARSKRNFVPINCAAIPDNLLESELFGHEAGSFTGAGEARIGLIESAAGGTVFLDEIGEMPLALQAKLLRVIEDKKVRRVGSNKERPIDVRFISATHRDLSAMVAEKSFREDLYYRLNVISIYVPPLRERREDLQILLDHFLKMYSTRQHPAPTDLTPEAHDLILRYPWPGNCRELANLAQFLIFGDRDGVIGVDDLPQHFVSKKTQPEAAFDWSTLADMPLVEAKKYLFDKLEENYVRHALLKNDWNISATAETCGIDRRTIHRIINRFELKRPVK